MDKQRAQQIVELATRLINVDVSTLSEQQLAERNNMIFKLKEEIKMLDEASLATMRDYFAGDEEARDPFEITKQRLHFSKDPRAKANMMKKFRSPAEYEDWLKQNGLKQVSTVKEFAPDDGDSGEEETLHKYARMWYNGDLSTQQQVEQILARMGWEIGELESEEGGAFVVQAGDEHGDSYIGFAVADLTEGVAEGEDIDARIANLKDAIRFETPRSVPGEDHKEQYVRHAEKIAGYKAELKKLVARKKQGLAEDFNGEYDDEAGMAKSNLRTMSRAVNGLLDTIQDNDNLPEWAQEKIAKAEMMVTSVWDYLLSQKEQGIDPKMESVDNGMPKDVRNKNSKLTAVTMKKTDTVSEEINTEAYERLQKVFAFKNYES